MLVHMNLFVKTGGEKRMLLLDNISIVQAYSHTVNHRFRAIFRRFSDSQPLFALVFRLVRAYPAGVRQIRMVPDASSMEMMPFGFSGSLLMPRLEPN